MTRAQKRFLLNTPASGWRPDCLTGSELAMADRLTEAGLAEDRFIQCEGRRIYPTATAAAQLGREPWVTPRHMVELKL